MRVLDVQFQMSRFVTGAGEGTDLSRRVTRRSTAEPHVSRKHQLHRRHRSRSSPVRFELSCSKSPCYPARSPSVSPPRRPRCPSNHLPFATDNTFSPLYNGATGTMAYYSPRPPVRPLHIVPMPTKPMPALIPFIPLYFDTIKAKKKEAKQIVHCLLRSLLKEVLLPNQLSFEHASFCHPASENDHIQVTITEHCDVGVQSQSTHSVNMENTEMQNELNSNWSGEEDSDARCKWVGGVRALRDSHVRLLLRQLRQLRHIDRLSRVLRREHHPVPAPSSIV